MIYVLYGNKGVHSGRALRAQIGKNTKLAVRGGFSNRLLAGAKKDGTPSLLINLGSTGELPEAKLVLNSPEMVKSASHKRAARQSFLNKGVPSPALFLQPEDVKKADLPVIGRTSQHSKGQGFWFCTTLDQVKRAAKAGATHFLEFVDGTREYRVHTFIRRSALGKKREERAPEDYVSIKISEKVQAEGAEIDPKAPQKNHQFGWIFLGPQNRREEELDVIRHAGKQAVAALGMDFGAADIMYKISTKEPFVLEVNSTPSLADENADTCERYAERVLKLVPNK